MPQNLKGQGVLNVGYGNYVATSRVLAILNAGSAPIKRLREDAKEQGKLLDVSQGRRTRSIVVIDEGLVLLSAVITDTLAQRYEDALLRRHDAKNQEL